MFLPVSVCLSVTWLIKNNNFWMDLYENASSEYIPEFDFEATQ